MCVAIIAKSGVKTADSARNQSMRIRFLGYGPAEAASRNMSPRWRVQLEEARRTRKAATQKELNGTRKKNRSWLA
jgi:hypothetical protein